MCLRSKGQGGLGDKAFLELPMQGKDLHLMKLTASVLVRVGAGVEEKADWRGGLGSCSSRAWAFEEGPLTPPPIQILLRGLSA